MKISSLINMAFQWFFSLAILALAVPVGLWIARLAWDELVPGRVWFRWLVVLGVITGAWFWLTGERAAALASLFITIVALISYTKSFDKKWTNRKF